MYVRTSLFQRIILSQNKYQLLLGSRRRGFRMCNFGHRMLINNTFHIPNFHNISLEFLFDNFSPNCQTVLVIRYTHPLQWRVVDAQQGSASDFMLANKWSSLNEELALISLYLPWKTVPNNPNIHYLRVETTSKRRLQSTNILAWDGPFSTLTCWFVLFPPPLWA